MSDEKKQHQFVIDNAKKKHLVNIVNRLGQMFNNDNGFAWSNNSNNNNQFNTNFNSNNNTQLTLNEYLLRLTTPLQTNSGKVFARLLSFRQLSKQEILSNTTVCSVYTAQGFNITISHKTKHRKNSYHLHAFPSSLNINHGHL